MENLIPSVVAALSAGAIAAAKGLGGDLVKDSYGAIKTLISDRYKKAAAAVETLEAEPESELEQAVLEKRLETDDAGGDVELAVLTKALIDALKQLEDTPEAAALFDFGKLRATAAFELSDIDTKGTVLKADKASFKGDFSARNIRQKN